MIKVENVTKRYGTHVAVNRLSFTVSRGEVLGFLGPNGAGKTTTMNIITGYISATEGRVEVGGHDILEEPLAVKKMIGYMPEFPPLYGDMTVREYLDFVTRIKKVPPEEEKTGMEKIMDLVRIGDVQDRLIRNLSKGYKQRVGLAQALVGNPPVLILDEPTIGLDPKQIIEIRTLIKELGKEHTIILSSHILPEVSVVCERVIIINKGEIVAGDTPENLAHRLSGKNRLLVRVAGPEDRIRAALANVEGVKNLIEKGSAEPGAFDFLVEAELKTDIRKPIFYAMSNEGYPILMLKPVDLTLEEIFLQIITEEREVS
ncbi:MAG TPA: ATP-binding cassette domain-containing protein [Firmicutes bacterium]|nr:ATP-binding cassette domain-containing protein [Bacillota bacterium]